MVLWPGAFVNADQMTWLLDGQQSRRYALSGTPLPDWCCCAECGCTLRSRFTSRTIGGRLTRGQAFRRVISAVATEHLGLRHVVGRWLPQSASSSPPAAATEAAVRSAKSP